MFFLHMTEDKVVLYNPTPPSHLLFCNHKTQRTGGGRAGCKKCSVQQPRAGGATHVFILSYPMSKQHLQRKRSNWGSKLFCKLDLQPLLVVKELTLYDLSFKLLHSSFFRNMLPKLIRLLKVKQRLSLDPLSGNDIPAHRYAVFRIEVSAMLYIFFNIQAFKYRV